MAQKLEKKNLQQAVVNLVIEKLNYKMIPAVP